MSCICTHICWSFSHGQTASSPTGNDWKSNSFQCVNADVLMSVCVHVSLSSSLASVVLKCFCKQSSGLHMVVSFTPKLLEGSVLFNIVRVWAVCGPTETWNSQKTLLQQQNSGQDLQPSTAADDCRLTELQPQAFQILHQQIICLKNSQKISFLHP